MVVLLSERIPKHHFGAGVQIRLSGAQDRSLLKLRGTHSPSTKYPHGGTGNTEGDAFSRTDLPEGTLSPRSQCPWGTLYTWA